MTSQHQVVRIERQRIAGLDLTPMLDHRVLESSGPNPHYVTDQRTAWPIHGIHSWIICRNSSGASESAPPKTLIPSSRL